jgi:hypothetical protein
MPGRLDVPTRWTNAPAPPPDIRERGWKLAARQLADQAFSRAAGAPLVPGNNVRILERCGGELSGLDGRHLRGAQDDPFRVLHHP